MSFLDYERAAEMSNLAREAGIQATPTDALLWAVSERRGAAILTTGRAFVLLRPILGI